jgi:curved DNA-binding protein CbpA
MNTILNVHARHFHTTHIRKDDHGLPNHYETLDLHTNASAADIKNQFYKLSKAHHPDLHPNDPDASQRFVRISEAYATLGSADKRVRYDRDFLRATSPANRPARSGSYSSSSTPAGGRPASGLSRRRTQFRGPPPSFYRSGGWGEHGEKRAEHARKASHSREAQGRSASGPQGPDGYGGYSQTAGTGPGGFASGYDSDVPHFDHRGHYQTHSEIERTRHKARRKQSQTVRREEAEAYERGTSTGLGFVTISIVLLLALGLPAAAVNVFDVRGRRRNEDKR